MFHEPELVKRVIVAQKLTRLIAYELNTQDRIDTVEGTQADLCGAVDYLYGVVPGPFRIECGTQDDVVGKGGRSSVKRTPFVWKLNPKAAAAPAPAPAPATAPAPAPVYGKVPEGYKSAEEVKMLLDMAELRAELRRQTHCSHDVPYTRDCPACQAEEPEEEGEEEQQGAVLASTDTKEVIVMVRDIIRELRGPGRIESKGITGPVSDEMSEEDRQVWRAIQRMRMNDDKGQFQEYKQWLLENYGEPKQDQDASKGGA